MNEELYNKLLNYFYYQWIISNFKEPSLVAEANYRSAKLYDELIETEEVSNFFKKKLIA